MDLVSKLLQDISRRYGNLRDGCKDIKEHAFYAGAHFDWTDYGRVLPDQACYQLRPVQVRVAECREHRHGGEAVLKESAMFAGF